MKEAFLKVYDESVDDIFNYCYTKTADRIVATSITAEAFAALWDHISFGHPISEASLTLKNITSDLVRRELHNKLKAEKTPRFMPVMGLPA